MNAALYDPDGGYYQRAGRERWGREGDYRTSPERSELFAATFALYFVRLFEELQQTTVVECGAGDGSFAVGVLRTLREQFPEVFAATRYMIYDVSDDALNRARERVGEFEVEFCSDWDRLKAGHGIYFANELLDAFPVHRVVRRGDALLEQYVDVDAGGAFAWATGPLSTPRLLQFCDDHSIQLAEGQTIEINLRVDDWLAQVASKLERGFVITVDYGAEVDELYDPRLRPNGSLRGFSRHAFVEDLLAQPGEYDLTTTVNWTHVKRAGQRLGFKVVEFVSQDKFLLSAGLLEQLQYRLNAAQSEAEKLSLTTGAREMILPGGMASSFQVLVQKRSV
jgi:SAM-dependent MidA family methyltransferase